MCDMLDIAMFWVLIMKQQTQKLHVLPCVCRAHITPRSKVSMASTRTLLLHPLVAEGQ